MKNIIKIALLLVSCSDINAQNIYNGNFSINNGNDEPIGTCSGTFSSTSVPNWKRTHGTPNFVSCSGSSDNIFMSHDSQVGEGIAGGYQFTPGETYRVRITICNPNNILFNSNEKLVVMATAILPQNLPTVNTQCVTTIPVLPVLSFELMQNITSISQAVNQESIAEFFYTMDNQPLVTSKQYIWIYPEAANNETLAVVIKSVSVQPICKEDLIINENTEETEQIPEVVTNPHITPGVYTGYRHIHAGAPYTPPNKWVRVPWWNVHTVFVASESITLSPVFEAERAGADGSFLAYIDPNLCFRDEGAGYGGEAKPGKPQENHNENNFYSSDFGNQVIINTRLSIYPNPTTGAFHIEMPQRGNYTLRVMNMLGSTVYEGKMADEQKKSIQLDNNLPPGNYTLDISGDGLRHVERITLIK